MHKENDNRKILPAIALRGMTILPNLVIHFDVSRDKSIQSIEKSMISDQYIFLVTQKDLNVEEPSQKDLYQVGIIAKIQQVVKVPNNILRILVEGKERARLIHLLDDGKFLEAEIQECVQVEEEPDEETQRAMFDELESLFLQYTVENPKLGKSLVKQAGEVRQLDKLVDFISVNIPLYYDDKQKLLEAVELKERFETLCVLLHNEIQVLKIRRELQLKVKEKVDKNQKEYVLREQMKAIREELGEDSTVTDADEFKQRALKLNADKEVKDKILKEIDRFRSVSSNSSESAVIRGYIETLLEMPWNKKSKDNKDLKKARQILESDHYGLEKIKERILEFLAVRTLTKNGEAPIICLVGPPGTGKTSIAKSIARALGKQYVRICLGGVRDEAEIRGHRKTYVGAMPGRIATGIKSAGVKNPLILLDEIDKVSSDYKGDTSAALLEVLDAEQNYRFQDHYIEQPIDLSEVLFIATANSLQTISRPLLDRMEVLDVSSYTENEKLHIAREYLVRKQMKKNGLKEKQLVISQKSLENIIRFYTREAGVRNLERKIGTICRKAAWEILEQGKEPVRITEANLKKYLGKEKYQMEYRNEQDDIGVVRGLAWTSVGGDTLQIEVNIMPGKGHISMTGQLGDVMQESAKIGISYIRSVSGQYKIPDEFFKKNDIHIHIPAGAVPKDGPSAGITMVTAMLSAITKTPVSAKIAMTGEVTLRGRVLPIGGLKEKLLAAKTAGIEKVLVPYKNEADVEEIPKEIKKDLQIIYVKQMDEVIEQAFVKQ